MPIAAHRRLRASLATATLMGLAVIKRAALVLVALLLIVALVLPLVAAVAE